MQNGKQHYGKVPSSLSLIKLRWLLRPLWQFRKWITSAGFTNGLYRLGWCLTALFLVSILLEVILLSNILTLVTIFICGTLGCWKLASSRKRRRRLYRRLLRVKEWTSRASLVEWLYLLGFCLINLLPISMLLEVIRKFNILTVKAIFLYGASGCFAVGFTSEIRNGVVTHWKSPQIKRFLAFLVGVITVISPVPSRFLINSFTRVDPFHFPVAVTILAIILIPIIWLALAVVALLLVYSVYIVLVMPISFGLGPFVQTTILPVCYWLYRFLLGKPKVPHRNFWLCEWMNRFALWAQRAMGAVTLAIALIWLSGSVYSQYQEQIYRQLTYVLVYTNYQHISDECKNYRRGEWVASIGERKISVAIPDKSGGYTFQTRSCN